MEGNNKLIFDIGMHKGEDTSHYLSAGFKVIAVEANPILADECRKKFADQIAKGNLTIVNAGIAKEEGVLPFYVNLHSSEWSSFD
jgi:FkbM family methyltransferase